MPQKPRGRESVGDAVRSVVVLLGLLAVAVLAFTVTNPEERLPAAIDYGATLEIAREEFSYDVLAPAPVPADWRATSVEAVPDPAGDRWRLGFLLAGEDFIGIEQSDGETVGFVEERLTDFTEEGEVRIGGLTWTRWLESDDEPDRALVATTEGDAATIVRGTTDYAELERFVGLLSAG